MKRLRSKKSVTKRWRVKTGTIDVVGVEADSPMEAATKVFDQLKEDTKIESENRLFNIGMITECSDLDRYRKDPENNIFYVLTSKVLANAGLHSLCKDMETFMKGYIDEEKRL